MPEILMGSNCQLYGMPKQYKYNVISFLLLPRSTSLALYIILLEHGSKTVVNFGRKKEVLIIIKKGVSCP
jgi:hypothetical protein